MVIWPTRVDTDPLPKRAGPIIVYSAYEKTRLNELAGNFLTSLRIAQCNRHPLGGPAADRARCRLLARILVQQFDKIRRSGSISGFRL
jgi:hypothetical protein